MSDESEKDSKVPAEKVQVLDFPGGGPKIYIHHEAEVTYYSVTEDELDRLYKGGQTAHYWLDISIASFAVGVPTLLNGIADTVKGGGFLGNVL